MSREVQGRAIATERVTPLPNRFRSSDLVRREGRYDRAPRLTWNYQDCPVIQGADADSHTHPKVRCFYNAFGYSHS